MGRGISTPLGGHTLAGTSRRGRNWGKRGRRGGWGECAAGGSAGGRRGFGENWRHPMARAGGLPMGGGHFRRGLSGQGQGNGHGRGRGRRRLLIGVVLWGRRWGGGLGHTTRGPVEGRWLLGVGTCSAQTPSNDTKKKHTDSQKSNPRSSHSPPCLFAPRAPRPCTMSYTC